MAAILQITFSNWFISIWDEHLEAAFWSQLKLKQFHFYSNFTEVYHKFSVDNKLILVQMMAWFHTGCKILPTTVYFIDALIVNTFFLPVRAQS